VGEDLQVAVHGRRRDGPRRRAVLRRLALALQPAALEALDVERRDLVEPRWRVASSCWVAQQMPHAELLVAQRRQERLDLERGYEQLVTLDDVTDQPI
jgi:hypothetical protein